MIQVLLFISLGLLVVAPVLDLNQSQVHVQILMLQPCLPFSKVLQILLHSLVETCLPHYVIIWLKNSELIFFLQIAARLVYVSVGGAILQSSKLSSKPRIPSRLVAGHQIFLPSMTFLSLKFLSANLPGTTKRTILLRLKRITPIW